MTAARPKPVPHCGTCDPRTRLIWPDRDDDGPVTRCPRCHPLAGQLLPQHRRCPRCRMITYRWDYGPCAGHPVPGRAADTRPERERIDAIIAAETARRYDPGDGR